MDVPYRVPRPRRAKSGSRTIEWIENAGGHDVNQTQNKLYLSCMCQTKRGCRGRILNEQLITYSPQKRPHVTR